MYMRVCLCVCARAPPSGCAFLLMCKYFTFTTQETGDCLSSAPIRSISNQISTLLDTQIGWKKYPLKNRHYNEGNSVSGWLN